MRFQSRVFQLAKDPENPQQYEDAYRLDATRGVAAIADGVSASMFSGPWAEILTAAAVDAPPDPGDRAALAAWLAALRQSWTARIDSAALTWFQKAKLKLGAFSTLLWVRFEPLENEGRPTPGEYRLRGFAIGDSCLFHVREGRLLRSFPIQNVAQFQTDPLVIGSLDLNRDDRLLFASLDEPCREGDLVVLCTDALAAWCLRRAQSEDPPPWEAFWTVSDEAWRREMGELRAREELRYDDTTLVLLRVTPDVPAAMNPVEPRSERATAEIASAVTADDVDAQSPGPAAEPRPSLPPSAGPPPLPCGPPPLPDWMQTVNETAQEVSQQVSDVTGQLLRGMKQLKETALRKYRDKFPPRDPS
jgi:hypothetical protein